MGTRKGLRDVRSLAGPTGWGTHSKERHVYQFRLGALELERTRLALERERVLARVQSLDTRLFEIDREMCAHRSTLATGAFLPAAAGPPMTTASQRKLRY